MGWDNEKQRRYKNTSRKDMGMRDFKTNDPRFKKGASGGGGGNNNDGCPLAALGLLASAAVLVTAAYKGVEHFV